MPSEADLLLGRLAVSRQLITPPQLDQCVQIQIQREEAGKAVPLGSILVEKGLLTPAVLQSLLDAQKIVELRRRDVALGRLAVRNNLLTEPQLEEALAEQKSRSQNAGQPFPRIGQIFIERGFMTKQQLDALAKAQGRLLSSPQMAKKKTEFVQEPLALAPSADAGPIACPVCDQTIEMYQVAEPCPGCGKPHHTECYSRNAGCGDPTCAKSAAQLAMKGPRVQEHSSSFGQEQWMAIGIKGAIAVAVLVAVWMGISKLRKGPEYWFNLAQAEEVNTKERNFSPFDLARGMDAIDEATGKIEQLALHDKWLRQADFYQRAIDLKPDYIEARYELAVTLIKLKEEVQALAQVSELIKMAPEHVDAILLRGSIYDKDNQPDRAEENYRAAIKIKPEATAPKKALALLIDTKFPKRRSDAVRCYEDYLRGNPEDAELQGRLGILLAETERYEEAEGHLSKAVTLDVENPKVKAKYVFILGKRGKAKEAIAYAREILAKQEAGSNPLDFTEVHLSLGMMLLQEGRADEGLDELKRAAGVGPPDFNLAVTIAEILLDRGDASNAYPYLETALQIRTADLKALLLHAQAATLLEIDVRALEDLKKIRGIAPKTPGLYSSLAKVALHSHSTDEARGYLRDGHEVDPGDPLLPILEAAVFREQGEFDKAYAALDKILHKDEKNSAAHVERGYCHRDQGSTADALDSFRTAYELDGNADAAYELGQIYSTVGDMQQAARFYKAFLNKVQAGSRADIARYMAGVVGPGSGVGYSGVGGGGGGGGGGTPVAPAVSPDWVFQDYATRYRETLTVLNTSVTPSQDTTDHVALSAGLTYLAFACASHQPDAYSDAVGQITASQQLLVLGVYSGGDVSMFDAASRQGMRDGRVSTNLQTTQQVIANLVAAVGEAGKARTLPGADGEAARQALTSAMAAKTCAEPSEGVEQAGAALVQVLGAIAKTHPRAGPLASRVAEILKRHDVQAVLCENTLQKFTGHLYATAEIAGIYAQEEDRDGRNTERIKSILSVLDQTDDRCSNVGDQMRNALMRTAELFNMLAAERKVAPAPPAK